MTEGPLFSLIVPVYKVEKYLNQCIDSLLSQEFNDYEIILVDDGSPDSCPFICDEYAARCDNVKVVHKPNGGLSEARNKGLEYASGRYVTFVDSDDFWMHRDVLRDNAEIIKRYNPDIIVSDIIKYYTNSNKYIYPGIGCSNEYNGMPKLALLRYFYYVHSDLKMSACQKFVKRELLICHPFTSGLLSEDIDWSLKIYAAAHSICVYERSFYCYRQQRAGSITNTASQRSFDSLMLIIDKWKVQIADMQVEDEERQIYFGYLAYQLGIAMSLVPKLKKPNRLKAVDQIKKNRDLFCKSLNCKSKKINTLVRIVGIVNTCRILSLFLLFREFVRAR